MAFALLGEKAGQPLPSVAQASAARVDPALLGSPRRRTRSPRSRLRPELGPRGALTGAGPAMASADTRNLGLGPGDAHAPRRRGGNPLLPDPRPQPPTRPKPSASPRAGGSRPSLRPTAPPAGRRSGSVNTRASPGHSPLFSAVTKKAGER